MARKGKLMSHSEHRIGGEIMVDSDFPGGNIIVDRIAGDTIWLHQDLRDTEGDWFYFHFRVRNAAGRTINVEFTKSAVLGPLGPAVSYDDGATWNWLGAQSMREYSAFTCHLPADAVRFAFAVPYTGADLAAFLARHQGNSNMRVVELCKSRKGRMVPKLRLGNKGAGVGVALTCRHHACEMVGNYALEGFIDAVLADDKVGARLRDVDILIVPFVDMVGVEDE